LSITIVSGNHNASVESVGRRIQSFQDITRILIIGITQVGSAEKNATSVDGDVSKVTKHRAEPTFTLIF